MPFATSTHFNVLLSSCLQILFELIAKGGTVKSLIEEKDLVQASDLIIIVVLSTEIRLLVFKFVDFEYK